MPSPLVSSSGRPLYVELELSWLIARVGLTTEKPQQRLAALENAVALLGRPWRPYEAPISPARDLRMSAATRDRLTDWVQAAECATGQTLARLAVYWSGALGDESVPEGWVRLLVHSMTRSA
jgi:hypothetical protein